MIIAIDGPAGAGKSTVAERIAEKLKYTYLDTGAMYRVFTLLILTERIPLENIRLIENALKNFKISFKDGRVLMNGIDVTDDIRNDNVTNNVSYISSLSFVRKKMVELQRNIGQYNDIVIEGRDIGTVVFPDADYKFYLDASIEIRAKRRLKDEKDRSKTSSLQEMIIKIKDRDNYDSSREISPLKKADNAIYIDSTNMAIDEVCNAILNKINKNKNILGVKKYGKK